MSDSDSTARTTNQGPASRPAGSSGSVGVGADGAAGGAAGGLPGAGLAGRVAASIPGLTRTRVVWGALAASMTAAFVGLTAMNGGVATSAPVAAAGIGAPSVSWRERIMTFDAGVGRRAFGGIVIHHSGTTSGSASSIMASHEERGIRDLGYHFVIGNGKGSHDGEIQVGPRWTRQGAGAHVAGPRARALNGTTIGICVVGDGDRRPLTAAQFASLVQLVRTIQSEYGIGPERVVLHRDVAATGSPGRLFPELDFERRLLSAEEALGPVTLSDAAVR